ncbi:MAG: bifunctional precorrin-2 dehydrogenase/sirohydrochlorin ferrochelatase [Acidobacteria bacterium]|nr:bifunctional precorrin-2 dehydrogenase/sirohydrochlorin ferrochelatase [Acidobacteriota bacterium]
MKGDPQLFPMFFRIAGRRVVLVGGGAVAAAKLESLLEAGADVIVIAPRIDPRIERSGVIVKRRPFAPDDLDGAWFAVAAAPPEVNRQVAVAAEERRMFVNAADDPAHASAFMAAVLRRGEVTIAISTNGRAPALAGLLREGLNATLPADLDVWMSEACNVRRRWIAEATPILARRPLLLQALNRLYSGRARGTGVATAGPEKER